MWSDDYFHRDVFECGYHGDSAFHVPKPRASGDAAKIVNVCPIGLPKPNAPISFSHSPLPEQWKPVSPTTSPKATPYSQVPRPQSAVSAPRSILSRGKRLNSDGASHSAGAPSRRINIQHVEEKQFSSPVFIGPARLNVPAWPVRRAQLPYSSYPASVVLGPRLTHDMTLSDSYCAKNLSPFFIEGTACGLAIVDAIDKSQVEFLIMMLRRIKRRNNFIAFVRPKDCKEHNELERLYKFEGLNDMNGPTTARLVIDTLIEHCRYELIKHIQSHDVTPFYKYSAIIKKFNFPKILFSKFVSVEFLQQTFAGMNYNGRQHANPKVILQPHMNALAAAYLRNLAQQQIIQLIDHAKPSEEKAGEPI